MFYQPLLTDKEKAIQQEVRKFVREAVTHDFIRALDRDEIKYPREYVEELAAHNLLGLRFDSKWGGRGLPWTAEVIAEEEIGVLGTTLGCAFVMPSIVGEALHVFGTDEQKERFLKPILQGKFISAEALTEPRGGSDFFGATTRADIDGDHFVLSGQKRFVVGASEADVFLVYCRTNFDQNAHKYQRISAIMVERGPGVETEYRYGLMGTRGGGTGRLVFRNVRVPRENLIGQLHGGASVFHQMMIPERMTSAAGGAPADALSDRDVASVFGTIGPASAGPFFSPRHSPPGSWRPKIYLGKSFASDMGSPLLYSNETTYGFIILKLGPVGKDLFCYVAALYDFIYGMVCWRACTASVGVSTTVRWAMCSGRT